MPSNRSVTRLPFPAARTRNVVRYHHGTAYGLAGSIAVCTKFAPIGYVMPGRLRRFIPKNGSLKVPFCTSPPTTVDGAVALYQPCARYAPDEIAAPSTPTFAEDAS